MDAEKFQFGEARYILINGEKWWCLRDLQNAIGCAQAVEMIERLPKDTMKLEYVDGRNLVFVNNEGLWACKKNAETRLSHMQ